MVFAALCVASLDRGLGNPTASPAEAREALQLFSISILVYLISSFLVKVSIALTLFRIASAQSRVRVFLRGSVILLTILAVACLVLWGMQCTPYPALWGEPGTCRSSAFTAGTAYFISATDISFTWLYAVSHWPGRGKGRLDAA